MIDVPMRPIAHLEAMTDAELYAHLEHCDGPRLRAYCRLAVLRIAQVRQEERAKALAHLKCELAHHTSGKAAATSPRSVPCETTP